jgi:hypothetical protein
MLVAVLLLPVDIAVRRLVVTRRDMERAWAATFGRWRPPPVVQERSEQVSRLFQAKQRAGTKGDDGEETAVEPTPISRQDAIVAQERKESKKEGVSQPVPQPVAKPSSSSGKTLASRLLEKKRQQDDKDN